MAVVIEKGNIIVKILPPKKQPTKQDIENFYKTILNCIIKSQKVVD